MKKLWIALSTITFMFIVMSESRLASYTALTNEFASACLKECTDKKSQLSDCGMESIVFIVRQYNLAAGGRPNPGEKYYPCTDVAHYYNCKEWRSKQLHDLCPSTVDKAKIRWTNHPRRTR
jgi:hypothetical protein